MRQARLGSCRFLMPKCLGPLFWHPWHIPSLIPSLVKFSFHRLWPDSVSVLLSPAPLGWDYRLPLMFRCWWYVRSAWLSFPCTLSGVMAPPSRAPATESSEFIVCNLIHIKACVDVSVSLLWSEYAMSSTGSHLVWTLGLQCGTISEGCAFLGSESSG